MHIEKCVTSCAAAKGMVVSGVLDLMVITNKTRDCELVATAWKLEYYGLFAQLQTHSSRKISLQRLDVGYHARTFRSGWNTLVVSQDAKSLLTGCAVVVGDWYVRSSPGRNSHSSKKATWSGLFAEHLLIKAEMCLLANQTP